MQTLSKNRQKVLCVWPRILAHLSPPNFARPIGQEPIDLAVADSTPAMMTLIRTLTTNTRLCKALIDRITDQAHIIETGGDSYRFRRTTQKRKPPLQA
jgi:hypothetical protein